MTSKKILNLFISSLFISTTAHASIDLIAIGSIDGSYTDLSTQTAAPLENGVPGNRLGGIGSGLAYAGGTTFLALPDRGPNSKAYNRLVDDSVSYIDRFQTIDLSLSPSDPGSALPFTLTPTLRATTLLSSPTPLVYGTGAGLDLGPGAPALNTINHTYYFTGRSDNFDPTQSSSNPNNGRLDPEAIRVSHDGKSVFIPDEYGPHLYQFDRKTGKRIRSFTLPDNLAISVLSPQKRVEMNHSLNPTGRITNKGLEGLAITPNGKMLVSIMQTNLQQDKKKSLRIITIDIKTGTTHEYAYKLTDGSLTSELIAINDHQFLVAERKGKGLADTALVSDEATPAEVKKLFLIDLDGATEVSNISGDLSDYAVDKKLFLDVVSVLNAHGIDSLDIPSKLEGLAFGPDVVINGVTKHTLYLANDNDFLATVADPHKLPGNPTRGVKANPNMFYVFAFGDNDLPGYVPQQIKPLPVEMCEEGRDNHNRSHK